MVGTAVTRICAAVNVRYGNGFCWHMRCRKHVYYAWMAYRHAELCLSWFDFLDSEEIQPFRAVDASLPLKPFKPYLALGLDIGGRMRVIRDSLLFLLSHRDALQNVIHGKEAVLATIDLGAESVLSLFFKINCQKEGELTLLLRFADGRTAAISAFAFERKSDGSHVMRIGRIQGVKDPEMQRQLEKAMHGLRPKALMLAVSQEVAHALDVNEVYGVANDSQVYRRKVLIAVPGFHGLSFDYDALWLESGGVLGSDGWFRLPSRLEKRQPSEMKPNKRSMYKKRYALLDGISAQIHRALGHAAPAVNPLPAADANI